MSAKPFWKSIRLVTLVIASGFILGCGQRELTREEVLANAQSAAATGDHATAIQTLEAYLQEHPGAFEVIDALAFLYAESGDPAMAAFYFNRAAEVDPEQPEYLIYTAEALESIGDTAGMIDSFERYLQVRPDAAIYRKLAETQASLGNRGAALDAYLQANRREPNGMVQVQLGQLYLASGNRAMAQTWFASAAQSGEASRAAGLLGLLEIALLADRFGDAETLVTTLDREFPEFLDASHLAQTRGQLAQWRRSQDEAAAALAALRERPSNPQPERETAETASTETTEPEAEGEEVAEPIDDLAEEPPSADPSPPFPEPTPTPQPSGSAYEELVALARQQAAAGAHTEAVRNFQRALARNDRDPAVWRDLSQAQFEAGQDHQAPASATEAMRRAPDDPANVLQYVRAASRTLPPNRMLQELERARARFPESAEVALALGRVYDEQGSRRYAGRMYAEFLRLADPEHPDRPEIEALLNN